MRNYIAVLFMDWQNAGGDHLYAFGADDAQLRYFCSLKEARADTQGVPPPWFRTTPRVIYWLLDDKNFARVLNGTMDLSAFFIYEATNLLPSGGVGQLGIDLRDISQVKDIEGSPRSTWSHGH